MDSKAGFRAVAIMQLVLSFIYVLVIGITAKEIVKNEFVELSLAVMCAYMFGVVIWSVVISMMLLFRAKSSYLLVALNVVVTVFLAIWLALSLADSKDAIIYLFLISFVYGTYIVFMGVLLLFPANVAENVRVLAGMTPRVRYVIVGATVVVFSLIPTSVYVFQETGYRYFFIENVSFRTSESGKRSHFNSSLSCFDMEKVKGHPWIQFRFNKAIEVSGIEIRPGSHSDDKLVTEDIDLANSDESAVVGDLYHLESALTKMKVSFDDDSSTFIELPDIDRISRLQFDTKKTSSVKIEIIDYRRGSKWNRLCLTHLRLLRKIKPFQVRTRVYSKEGDVVKIMEK